MTLNNQASYAPAEMQPWVREVEKEINELKDLIKVLSTQVGK